MQKDIFFIVYNRRPSQVLEPSEFESLWEEATNDGYEHLLTKILMRGELKLQDLFKGFQGIANLGVHAFLYYSQLELSLSVKRQLVSSAEVRRPNRQANLQQWNQDVNTSLEIFPPLLMKSWQMEMGAKNKV